MLKNSAAKKKDKKKREKEKETKKRVSPPVASSSKANGKESKRTSSSKKGKKSGGGNGVYNSDVLSFEQKKDLSETIQTLEGEKLERVIQIIHDGVPEVRDVRYMYCLHSLMYIDHDFCDRARKRLNSTSTSSQDRCCRSYIILSSCHSDKLHQSESAREQVRARAG